MGRQLATRTGPRAGHLGLGLALGLLTSLASPAGAVSTTRVVGPGVLDRPVFLTAPPGDLDRAFLVEQHTGRIRILDLSDHSIRATPFLTVAGVATGNEQGLLGLAFHPDYDQNGLFYVDYTDAGGDTVIGEYQVSADPDVADPTEIRILGISQPQTNHNGGWIAFGPDDGYLYIATGDGGGSNDDDGGHTAAIGNGQDITDNLLGKILRIDVDADDFPVDPDRNYAIPADNPFVGVTGDDEIWSYGLRNPYRASFDRITGDLYIGDVGQSSREEIDLQPALDAGHNFAWRLREGTIATPGVGGAKPAGALDPIFDYAHSGAGFTGCAVTGGYVYRGPLVELLGTYFFADYCTAELWSLRYDGSDPSLFDGTNYTDLTDHTGDPDFTPDQGSFDEISSFGEDAAGNLYVIRLGTRVNGVLQADTGEVFMLPEPSQPTLQLAGLAGLELLVRWRRRRRRS